MRTLSVREVANALGLTKRAVMYRIEAGKLKGTRITNAHGLDEWRIYANKEIIEALGPVRSDEQKIEQQSLNFEPEDETVEAEEITYSESGRSSDDLERLAFLAQKLISPLTARLEEQAVALREQETVIEEQKRQLRLLPDLEKRAEEERKAAELKALEVEALHKQVGALESERKSIQETEQQTNRELETVKAQLQELQNERTEADRARQKVEELEQIVARLKEEDIARQERALKELELLKEQKEDHARAIQEQLGAMQTELKKMKEPWWKKLFGPAPVDESQNGTDR